MSHKTRSQQQVERTKLRQRRSRLYKAYCDHIAKTHAIVLFEKDGIVYAARDGTRRILHRVVDPNQVWRETWELIRENVSTNNAQMLSIVDRIFRE